MEELTECIMVFALTLLALILGAIGVFCLLVMSIFALTLLLLTDPLVLAIVFIVGIIIIIIS